jgi:hypothetical protein
MVETYTNGDEEMLMRVDNGFIQDLGKYTCQIDETSEFGLSIERLMQGERSPTPFLYSLMLHASTDKESLSARQRETQRRKQMGLASKLPGFKTLPNGDNCFSVYENPKKNISVSCMYPVLNTDTHISIFVKTINDTREVTLEGAIASLPYAVRVFNQLSPYQLKQEAVDRVIQIAKESDLIKPKLKRRKSR